MTLPAWSDDLDPPSQLAYDAAQSSFDAILGAVSLGIMVYYSNQLAELGSTAAVKYPSTLDDQPDGPCVTCFSTVLVNPINDSRWTKKGLTYTFTLDPFTGVAIYNPQEGTFKKNN